MNSLHKRGDQEVQWVQRCEAVSVIVLVKVNISVGV